jgi:Protein of unknown function (DUF3617)
MLRWIAAAALAAATLPAAAQTMEPGEWEFKSIVSSPAMPQPQATVFKHCVTHAEAEDPTRFTAGRQTADCAVTPGERTPRSYTWTVQCPKQGMTGSGKARFGGATIESEMQVTADTGGQKMQMQTHVTGRRLGPRKPGE